MGKRQRNYFVIAARVRNVIDQVTSGEIPVNSRHRRECKGNRKFLTCSSSSFFFSLRLDIHGWHLFSEYKMSEKNIRNTQSSLTYSLIHLLTDWLTHWLTHSLSYIYSHIHSVTHRVKKPKKWHTQSDIYCVTQGRVQVSICNFNPEQLSQHTRLCPSVYCSITVTTTYYLFHLPKAEKKVARWSEHHTFTVIKLVKC